MKNEHNSMFAGDTGQSVNLKERFSGACQKLNKILALPELRDPRVAKAAQEIMKNNACKRIVFWPAVDSCAEEESVDGLEAAQNIVHDLEERTFQHISDACKFKQRKPSEDTLRRLARSPLYQAGYMLSVGMVDAVVAGAATATSDVIRAGLMTIGLAEGIKTVSGSFVMEKDSSIFLFSDAAVVATPSAEQLSDIAASSLSTWNSLFGASCEPVLSFLSFSTKNSAQHPEVMKITEAYNLFHSSNPTVCCDGELQFDAAFDKAIGQKKAPKSPVPGKTNIFIFPNLNAGNIGYKIAQRLGGFAAYGPIIQGLRKPYCDLSRGASSDDIVMTSYISMLMS